MKNFIKIIVVVEIIIITILYWIYQRNEIKKYFIENGKVDEEYENIDIKIAKEIDFYKDIIVQNYDLENSKNPYIPDGFKYLLGEWDTGFVIVDENSNEYVWVPCSNVASDRIVKLERVDFDNKALVYSWDCYDENYEEFLKSALTNGGFYISRYEIGNENNIPVSKKGIQPWSDITKEEAKDVIEKIVHPENVTVEMITGYAYDTAFSWIKKTNSTKFSKIRIDDAESMKTGRNQYNNIYDLFDNILEYSQEILYDTYVVRGATWSEKIEKWNRYNIVKKDNFFDNASKLTIRVVMYK